MPDQPNNQQPTSHTAPPQEGQVGQQRQAAPVVQSGAPAPSAQSGTPRTPAPQQQVAPAQQPQAPAQQPAPVVAPATPTPAATPVTAPAPTPSTPSAPAATPVQPPSPASPKPASKPAKEKKPGFFAKLFPKKQPKSGDGSPTSSAKGTPAAKSPDGTNDPKMSQKELQEIKEAEKLYNEGLATLKDLISPASMKIEYNHIKLNEYYVRSFMVYAYPRYIDINWLSPVINLDVTLDISMFIYPTDSVKILKTLRNKVAQMEASIRISQEKGQVRDPAIEAAYNDAEELRDKLQQGVEKFFQIGIYFTIYGKDLKELEHIGKQIESLLGGKLVVSKPVMARTEEAFNSCAPYGVDELAVLRNQNTEVIATTFPFTSSELTSNKGIMYGVNRHNNSLIIFDRFSLPNANSVIFATSGAGKSYAVKLEVLRTLMLGADVIIIDPENEYEALAEAVGGTYIRLSLNSEKRINPFDLPLPIHGQEEQPGDLLRQNIISLEGLMGLMLGEMSDEEKAVLAQAIVNTYALKGITMETEKPGAIAPPTMEDLHDILKDVKGGEKLAIRLEQYTEGIFEGIFNKPTNIDLNTNLVVFCIRDLDDILRPTSIYIVLNYIWNLVRSKLKKRMLVIDEAWSLMQHDDSARFLFGLVKRARKYYLGVTTITQDVEDFANHELGKPIITNASMQLLLKQAPSAIPKLKEIFNLTEGEEYYLLNSQVGEGIFFAGRKHVAIEIIASQQENDLITTNPEEIMKQDAEKADFEAH